MHVTGVTFNNPDHESRQDILKAFGIGYHYAILKQITFDDERAVEVWINSKLVGYVPKQNLSDEISYSEILCAQIAYNEDSHIYHINLSPIEPLNDAQYSQLTAFSAGHPEYNLIADKRSFYLAKIFGI